MSTKTPVVISKFALQDVTHLFGVGVTLVKLFTEPHQKEDLV